MRHYHPTLINTARNRSTSKSTWLLQHFRLYWTCGKHKKEHTLKSGFSQTNDYNRTPLGRRPHSGYNTSRNSGTLAIVHHVPHQFQDLATRMNKTDAKVHSASTRLNVCPPSRQHEKVLGAFGPSPPRPNCLRPKEHQGMNYYNKF